jgi:hypothetical protein
MQPDRRTRALRASDADREAAGERLRTAAIEGRLDPAEFEERLSAAYAARWCHELADLTADVTPPAPQRAQPARPTFEPSARINGFAIASLLLGLVAMWGIGSILAIVSGHVALLQIARSRRAQSGRVVAIAGLALGYLGLAAMLTARFTFML